MAVNLGSTHFNVPGVDIQFNIDAARWQADGRRKIDFILRKKFRERIEEFAEKIRDEIVKNIEDVNAVQTHKLADSFENINFVQQDITQGIFSAQIASNIPYVRFVEYGRAPGKAPFNKIFEWASAKFGADKKVSRAIWQRIVKRGFVGNHAPYHFIEKALNSAAGVVNELANQVGLDIEEAWVSDEE